MNLLDLGYKPKVISRDWEYGSDEDWAWLEFALLKWHNGMQVGVCCRL